MFATGTPISNSITEMYVMQRYLDNGLLERNGSDSLITGLRCSETLQQAWNLHRRVQATE